jgi:hypothetical protein
MLHPATEVASAMRINFERIVESFLKRARVTA